MDQRQRELLKKVVMRGKYAPLYVYLRDLDQDQWRASFADVEAVLGFRLPDSARVHRPWWANQGMSGGHSHALAWQCAGWKTAQVDLLRETLVFERDRGAELDSVT